MITLLIAASLLPDVASYYPVSFDDEQIILVERRSVERGRANALVPNVWTLKFDVETEGYDKVRMDFDCRRENAEITYIVEYDKNDEVTNQFNIRPTEREALPFIPNTHIAEIAKLVCSDRLPADWNGSPTETGYIS